MHSQYLLCLLLAVTAAMAQPKSVFAHFIVGNAAAMTQQDWDSDVELAQEALIDGFALNIAQQDPNTDAILQKAYTAAEKNGNFSLFLSFDYQSQGPWPMDRVISMINRYKDSPAQFYYQGKALVSTFEGTGNAGDWPTIRQSTGCFAIPDWTSMGPDNFGSRINDVDGCFSWDAWPVGTQNKSVDSDLAWMKACQGKPYMMPVSPWFYTSLPQWDKNWLWKGAHLWSYRWKQVVELQPEFVQILTWNDFGESSYIGPVRSEGIPQGSLHYVNNIPHDAWREFLPSYIAAYKAGNQPNIAVRKDAVVFWYRPTPNRSGSNGGTTGNNPQQGQQAMDPALLAEDKIYISAMVKAASQVTVQIGDAPVTTLQASHPGIDTFEVPFNGQMGNTTFSIIRNGQVVAHATGPAITTPGPDGNVNWNAIVGSS